MKHQSTKAFTLIELSIALVIIGLIVGGVLVGKDLVKAAEIRKTVSQKEKFDIAANTFRSKFNCLPGDCANASQFGLGSGTTHPFYINGNGNGDGNVCVFDPSGNAPECINFWYHLYSSKSFMDETWPTAITPDAASCFYPGFQSPKAPISKPYNPGALGCGSTEQPMRGGWEIVDADKVPNILVGRTGRVLSSVPFLGRSYVISVSYPYSDALVTNDLRAVDMKIDDGLPESGQVFAIFVKTQANDGSYTFAAPDSGCVNAGIYVDSNDIGRCALVVKAGF